MAKQTGPNPFIGRRGILLGYRMTEKYYVRVISSLTAKRVLKDPAFKLTMQYAGLLGKASKIASAVYRLLPEKEYRFYRKLTGMAMRLLKQGRMAEEAFEQLHNDLISPPLIEVSRRSADGRLPGIAFPMPARRSSTNHRMLKPANFYKLNNRENSSSRSVSFSKYQ